MLWFALLIPIAIIIITRIWFSNRVSVLECGLQFLASLIIILVFKISYGLRPYSDTEYWGAYVVEAKYEEEWNEYIHQICTRQVPSGTDSNGNTTYTTEIYDCSYVQYHGPQWYVIDSINRSHGITESHYRSLCNRFDNEKKTGHHSGHTISGDIFTTHFNGPDSKLVPVTTQHNYRNKVIYSKSIFKFEDISEQEAKELGLFDYPTVNKFNTPGVLGYKDNHKINVLNALLGPEKQIKIWVLVYDNGTIAQFEKQKQYWQNGNKNELVIGIGLKNNKVKWANFMTWCEADDFLNGLRNILSALLEKNINLDLLADKLHPLILEKWERKSFSDFEYLRIEPPLSFMWWSYIVNLLLSGGLAYLFVSNSHTDSDDQTLLKSFWLDIKNRWQK